MKKRQHTSFSKENSESSHQDLESGNVTDAGGHPHQPQSTHNSSLPSPQGGNDDHDSSRPLYAMYSSTAQEEDKNVAERRQQDADGVLVFTGLFSATVAALLVVTIPDLKPSSQDTSAFYLANIYQLIATSNGSVGSIPSTLVKPPPFSPPRYVVWVNSLWFMSLLISISSATFATLERGFISRRMSICQNEKYPSEIRARIRAMLVKNSGTNIDIQSGVQLLTMLHISLSLFLAGVLIYFFNISRPTFYASLGWILYFTTVYASITVGALFRPTELFYTPLSPMLFFIYRYFPVMTLILSDRSDPPPHFRSIIQQCLIQCSILEDRKRSVEKIASKPSPEIDNEILSRMLLHLDNDQTLERFFDAIPGFCESKLVQKPLDSEVTTKLRLSLDGFLDRTFSSRSVPESDRKDRLITCLDAAYSALGPRGVSQILGNFFNGHRDEALKSVEIGHSLVRWDHSSDDLIAPNVRRIVACIIARAEDRDDRWAKLVKEAFDIPDSVIRDYVAHGDSVLLAILNCVTRNALRTDRSDQGVLKSLSQINIHDTDAELRHEFCALWNGSVEKARDGSDEGARITAAQILTEIHHPFADLHQGTDSAPIRFPTPISGDDNVLSWPWSYRPCSIQTHHPNSAADNPTTTSPFVSALSTPIPIPDPCNSDSVVLSPSIGSALMQTDHVRHSLGGPSSASITTPLFVSPRTAAVSNQYPDARDQTTSAQHDSRITHRSILNVDHRRSPPGGTTGL